MTIGAFFSPTTIGGNLISLANEKLNQGIDSFLDWVESHYEDNRPAGHMTGFYPEKLIKMMKKSGFKNQ